MGNKRLPKKTHMHSNIVELTDQLRRQARVIGYVGIDFFISCGSNLPTFPVNIYQRHDNCIKLSTASETAELTKEVIWKNLLTMTLREVNHACSNRWQRH